MIRVCALLWSVGVLVSGECLATSPTSPTSPQPAGGSAAVLDEPGMPLRGCPSSPAVIAEILSAAGLRVDRVSAQQMADARVLCRENYDLLVLPTGETFPAVARDAVLQFLHGGGDLVTMGGYAFQDLVRQVDGQWKPEQEVCEAKLRDATRDDQSLVADGGFENADEPPIGGDAIDGRWRRTAACVAVSREAPYRGEQCGRVELSDENSLGSAGYSARVRVIPGRHYRASGAVRATQLAGPGIAYISIYQFDAQENIVDFRDFAAVREPCEWQAFAYQFVPSSRVDHVRIQCGFYRKSGVAFFDEVRLFDLTDVAFQPINTATGEPGDGLKVLPEQIGMFDPSYPLKRAAQLRTAAGQSVVQVPLAIQQPWSGWAASGVIGYDQARWIPLLETFDRYGHLRGPAGAMLLHYGGYYAGSNWIFFGVDNVDLFADRQGAAAQVLQQAVRFLIRKTYLRNLQTDFALYRAGESVQASVVVDNRGRSDQSVVVDFEWEPSPALSKPVRVDVTRTVTQGSSETFTADLGTVSGSPDVARMRARLTIGGVPVDELTTAVVARDDAVVRAGPRLRFVDNYFTLNGRPLFLFGTDTYARIYQSPAENPGTWLEELTAARDMGMNLYENLQYQRPGHKMLDEDWRKFLALMQLCQARGLVFMPGMLIGHNTAIGPALLAEQSQLCADYAQQLGDAPGLLYYVNGDYQQILTEHPQAVLQEWRQWLRSRYVSIEAWQRAWARSGLPGDFDQVEYPPPDSGRWDDVARIDDVRFRTELTARWNRAHVAAIRALDREHPITSEYYAQPSDGIDLPLTIDTQDVSNIGYFDPPGQDLQQLPWKISFADLRARGQGVSLGEYGVKTHPAWQESNGGTGYHIGRTEEQQKQLFMAVAHYGLGMGCSKIQNWCLRDDSAWVFPWGIFYPQQWVAKDVAYVHRNQSLAWRCLRPRYSAPPVVVCLANQLRLGNEARVGADVAYRASADLLALHVPFGCLDDDHLPAISPATRLLIYPCPFTLSDGTFEQLRTWVDQGGTLLLTGDMSYDADRRLTREDRLTALAGVRMVGRNYEHLRRDRSTDRHAQFELGESWEGVVRPCGSVEAVTADVLGRDEQGIPVLVRNRVGQGRVYYCTDPLELAADAPVAALRRALYRAVARDCGISPLAIEPDVPWLHVLEQPTAQGRAQVVFHTLQDASPLQIGVRSAAGQVQLGIRAGWPALAVTTTEGRVVTVNTWGDAAVDGQTICRGPGQKIVLSLDGADLRQSHALLVAPMDVGAIELPARPGEFVAIVGDFAAGAWTVAETISLGPSTWRLDIDPDRATMLMLVCPAAQQQQWAQYLETLLRHPDQLDGY
ncbi:MAG: beta-galactosidase [Pirellulaceae bacterium]